MEGIASDESMLHQNVAVLEQLLNMSEDCKSQTIKLLEVMSWLYHSNDLSYRLANVESLQKSLTETERILEEQSEGLNHLDTTHLLSQQSNVLSILKKQVIRMSVNNEEMQERVGDWQQKEHDGHE